MECSLQDPTFAGAVQEHMVALCEVAVQVAGGVAGACDARDLQHAAAPQLVQRQRRVKCRRHLQPVGLDAPHKVQLRPADAPANRLVR